MSWLAENSLSSGKLLASWNYRIRMPSVLAVNRGCCGHQAITLQLPPVTALKVLRMQTGLPPLSHSTLQPHPFPQWCTLRGFRMRKRRILAPNSWDAWPRNDFSEPRILHLPIHRKVLNSLTWNPGFNSNLLKFRIPTLCCKTSYISWPLLYFFRSIPQHDQSLCPELESWMSDE